MRRARKQKGKIPSDQKKFATLRILKKTDANLNKTKLLVKTRSTRPKYNVILNEMKDDGWITIESSKEHQTAQIVKLTDTGHKLAGAIIELLENNPELKKTRTFRESKNDSTEDE